MDIDTQVKKPHFSIPSLLAIVAAIASFFVSAGHGLFLAIVAIICGIIGLMLSFSPSIRGGIISTLSLILGAIGIIVALIRAFV